MIRNGRRQPATPDRITEVSHVQPIEWRAAALSAHARGRTLRRPFHPHAREASHLRQAIRQGASQSLNQTGEQVVSRSLSIQPTITIRPGFPVRVLVTHDLVLAPYKAER